jgi:hypothetical protein
VRALSYGLPPRVIEIGGFSVRHIAGMETPIIRGQTDQRRQFLNGGLSSDRERLNRFLSS